MKFFAAVSSFILIALVLRANDPAGTITLNAKDATLTGGWVRYQPETNRLCVGHWNGTSNTVSWKVTIPEKKTYRIFVMQSCVDSQAGSEFAVSIANQQANGIVMTTGAWSEFTELDLGPLMVRKPGDYELVVRPMKVVRNSVMNLRAIRLVPEP